ncbi:PREDICTED: esterase FE4-like [Trachymyrmex cornetzi]|uniref:Esterase FE4 n=1 Tax=Trachymyrmex cornetzi TaxID=471704 RepID=A0A195E5U2_9HYME|nr:PREDICTED: esterase FE4-like [Trachymyrmex cornetzi]KYN20565.1 Esterase FE4 [Trachymyrmex cornetzi]
MWSNKFVLCAFVVVWAKAEQDVQLEIPQGFLKGLKTSSVMQNRAYYSFKGIPYAKPNVGLNKFQMPEPAESWQGTYDGTYHRSSCPFFCTIQQDIVGEEDCLFLNVYTPVLDKDACKAVMVWFHGGNFNHGMGDDIFYGPDFLIEQDVVLVTLNYRLGAIGFLNTGDKNAPGNAGLKDQVMALKWVKDNIHYFGGCPNRVTIFGEDAGGSSVQFHMMSPMSDGLFNKAILQSGSAVNTWAISYDARDVAFKLGEKLDIETTDSAELVARLAEFSPKELIAASDDLPFLKQSAMNGRIEAFIPSVEADIGQEIFLPADPWTLLKSGKIADVPVMAGFTADESSFYVQMMLGNIDQINEHFENFLPNDLNITDAGQKNQLGESLKSYYFGDKLISTETTKEFMMMLDDVMFDAGIALSLEVLSSRISSPIFQYIFSYEAPFGMIKSLVQVEDGVAHGDDLTYEFYSDALKNVPQQDSPAQKMVRIYTTLLTNFAKDGNPTSNMNEYVNVNWEPRGTEDNYMNINQELKMEKGLLHDRIDFWKDLYKIVLG